MFYLMKLNFIKKFNEDQSKDKNKGLREGIKYCKMLVEKIKDMSIPLGGRSFNNDSYIIFPVISVYHSDYVSTSQA